MKQLFKKKQIQLLLSIFFVVNVFGHPLRSQDKMPSSKVSFEKIVLLNKYVSEGASLGDIDNDGNMDIVAGILWWKGPNFEESYAYAPIKYFPITGPGLEGYADNFFTFTGHFDTDQSTDILRIGLPGTDSQWIQNPSQTSKSVSESINAPIYLTAMPQVDHESPVLVNVIGDDKKEILAFSKGQLVLGVLPEKSTERWKMLAISKKDEKKFKTYSHGLGAGDINSDGKIDILEKSGWWEQPKKWNSSTPWEYHSYPFSSGKGGSQMFAYDVDGDGDNDVVTAMNAHGYGLSWYEQIVDKDGLTFKEHQVMTDRVEDKVYGVSFSQLHAMAKADIDNDGIPDIITGKCYYAHNGKDPGAEAPAVLYWFRTTRYPDKPAELVPYKIDDDSGVGRQISTGDLNQDGKVDIVVSNKKGVFAFIQK